MADYMVNTVPSLLNIEIAPPSVKIMDFSNGVLLRMVFSMRDHNLTQLLQHFEKVNHGPLCNAKSECVLQKLSSPESFSETRVLRYAR